MIFDKISNIKSPPLFFNLKNYISQSQLYLKLEGLNIATSLKLKSALKMINSIEKMYTLTPSKSVIVCSSSGNLAIAVSIICKEKGYRAICVTDPNVSPEAAQLIQLYGAELVVVDTKDENQGYLGTRIQYIQSLVAANKNVYWLNQYENNYNSLAHYETTGPEILHELPVVNYLFVGAGTTGTLTGVSQYFREFSPTTQIIAVDAEGSVTFGGDSKPRKIPGLGASRRPPLAEHCTYDHLVTVSERQTVTTCQALMNEFGLFVGGSTGSVMTAVKLLSHRFKRNDVVVALSPDFGSKYVNTLFNDEWVKLAINSELIEN